MNTEKETMSKGIAALESGPPIPIGVEDNDFIPRYLDPEKIRLFRSPMGAPRLEIIGEEVEIGIIEDPSRLDSESQKILREELDKRYFTPIIQKVHRVKERFGIHDWEVETSRGRITFSVQGLHQNVRHFPPARLLVTDVRGNRYDIPDYHRLDSHSFNQIQRHL
jgi:hypothetical protein